MRQNDPAFGFVGLMVRAGVLVDWLFFLYKTEELVKVLKKYPYNKCTVSFVSNQKMSYYQHQKTRG